MRDWQCSSWHKDSKDAVDRRGQLHFRNNTGTFIINDLSGFDYILCLQKGLYFAEMLFGFFYLICALCFTCDIKIIVIRRIPYSLHWLQITEVVLIKELAGGVYEFLVECSDKTNMWCGIFSDSCKNRFDGLFAWIKGSVICWFIGLIWEEILGFL